MVNALSMETEGSKHVFSNIVFSLILVLTQAQIRQVKADFIHKPVNQLAHLGTTAVFNCTADGARAVTYLVNSMSLIEMASIGVTQSEPVYSGSQITVHLYVPVTKDTKNCSVVCVACLFNGTRFYSPPAYLQDEAPPSAPQNLTDTTGATWVALAWSQPNDIGLGGDLSYKVSHQDVSQSLIMNITTTPYYNVTGLSPSTNYTMTVMADNGISGNEVNRVVSVNTFTKSTTIDTTHTSPEEVALVVVMCMVVVMAVLGLGLGLVLWMRKRQHRTPGLQQQKITPCNN